MSEVNPTPEELIEDVTLEVEASNVVPTPIDPTLSHEGEAADAKATGDAIAALSVVKSVNSQLPDETGNVSLLATQIPVSSEAGAQTIAEALESAQGVTADQINRTSENTQTVDDALGDIETALTDGLGDEEIDAMFEEEGEET